MTVVNLKIQTLHIVYIGVGDITNGLNSFYYTFNDRIGFNECHC